MKSAQPDNAARQASTGNPPRKRYCPPAVVHELQLETHAYSSILADPEFIDPELPAKPGGAPQGPGGIIDPPLPAKPAGRPSNDNSPVDPPLPPKPGQP